MRPRGKGNGAETEEKGGGKKQASRKTVKGKPLKSCDLSGLLVSKGLELSTDRLQATVEIGARSKGNYPGSHAAGGKMIAWSSFINAVKLERQGKIR